MSSEQKDHMTLEERAASLKTRMDLAEFLRALREDLDRNSQQWENPSLARYLEAMEAWVQDVDQYYRNRGQAFSENQSWDVFAAMLLAARVYE